MQFAGEFSFGPLHSNINSVEREAQMNFVFFFWPI